MEFGEGCGVVLEPVSPTGRYLSSSMFSPYVLAVLESEIPVDESQAIFSIQNLFLSITPRFSSVMVESNGKKNWKKVHVNVEDHVKIPKFPPNLSPESYDKFLDDYISTKLAVERFSLDKPLWEIHIINYPTSNAAGVLLFKLHHALGDGFSLMSALLSCLKRADNPSLALTFPSRSRTTQPAESDSNFFSKVFSSLFYTLEDFFGSISKTTVVEDDITPIRSGNRTGFQPMTFFTMNFCLDQIKSIKTKLGVTINDVLTGMISLGTRLYMQEMDVSSSKARTTAVMMLNTRAMGDYTSVQEMRKPDSKLPWGNHVTHLHIPIPGLSPDSQKSSNRALHFVLKAHKMIWKKRNSFAIILTSALMDILERFGGHEAAGRFLYNATKNSSMVISNMIGPVEQMAWANHRVKGLYFLMFGLPLGLDVTIVSYMGEVRIAFKMEKGLIDPQKFKSSMENAFQMILKASEENPTQK